MIDFISWVVMALAVIGAVANVKKLKWCFVLWIITNLYWAVFNFVQGFVMGSMAHYAQMAQYLVFLGLAVYGLITWIKDEIIVQNVGDK